MGLGISEAWRREGAKEAWVLWAGMVREGDLGERGAGHGDDGAMTRAEDR